MTRKGKCFASIQDIEAATTAQVDTHERGAAELLQNVARKGCVFDARGIILRGITGNVSFTGTTFYLNIQRIFITTRR